jgi:hypothetical protein
MGGDLDSLDISGTEGLPTYLGSSPDSFEDAVLMAITRFYKDNPDLYRDKVEVDFDLVRAEVHAIVENPPRVTDYKVVVGPKR